MNDSPQSFHLLWLTSAPLLRGTWVALALSVIPIGLAILALVSTLGLSEPGRGASLFSGALFLSLGAILIQFPAYTGRVELNAEQLTIGGRLSGRRGRLVIPRQSLQDVYFASLTRPPAWLPFAWGVLELLVVIGAFSAGWQGGGAHWYWLTLFAVGLCFWPLMMARRQAGAQVVIEYERGSGGQSGLIRGWATPQQAGLLVNTLLGKANWQVIPAEDAPGAHPDQPAGIRPPEPSDP